MSIINTEQIPITIINTERIPLKQKPIDNTERNSLIDIGTRLALRARPVPGRGFPVRKRNTEISREGYMSKFGNLHE